MSCNSEHSRLDVELKLNKTLEFINASISKFYKLKLPVTIRFEELTPSPLPPPPTSPKFMLICTIHKFGLFLYVSEDFENGGLRSESGGLYGCGDHLPL